MTDLDYVGQAIIWIDLVDDTTWHHSGETATYTNWANNEPDPNTLLEDCTQAFSSIGGRWRDYSCTNFAAYICEKDLH